MTETIAMNGEQQTSTLATTTKQCENCSKISNDLQRCSRCKIVYYCDQECQRANWPEHKKVCGKEAPATDANKQNTKTKKEKEEGLNQFGKLTHVGTGNFSIIYKTVSKKDGKLYAIKQVEKAKVQRMRKQADILMEKHCLNKLKDNPYVIRLYKTFQDELSLYFQMQFPEKGQLWQLSKIYGVIPNSLYKYYVSHIVKAVSILHNSYQIVHRDLKPENILLDSQNRIKLIDFGTAKDLDRPDIKGAGNGLKGKKQFEHYVGTAHYMAPECIHNKASEKKSDIYSLSGIIYFLKVGSPPFQGGSEYLTFTKSLENQLFTCPQLFDERLQDLISKMNCKQMENRIDINQVMAHQYFKDIDFENLPTFANSLEKVTEQEKSLESLCEKIKKIMESFKQPTIQKRKEIYQKEVKPILTQQLQKVAENSPERKRLEIVDMQCQCFLNIRDDNNISFTEIYKQMRGIAIKKATLVKEQKKEQKNKEDSSDDEGQKKQ